MTSPYVYVSLKNSTNDRFYSYPSKWQEIALRFASFLKVRRAASIDFVGTGKTKTSPKAEDLAAEIDRYLYDRELRSQDFR